MVILLPIDVLVEFIAYLIFLQSLSTFRRVRKSLPYHTFPVPSIERTANDMLYHCAVGIVFFQHVSALQKVLFEIVNVFGLR